MISLKYFDDFSQQSGTFRIHFYIVNNFAFNVRIITHFLERTGLEFPGPVFEMK